MFLTLTRQIFIRILHYCESIISFFYLMLFFYSPKCKGIIENVISSFLHYHKYSFEFKYDYELGNLNATILLSSIYTCLAHSLFMCSINYCIIVHCQYYSAFDTFFALQVISCVPLHMKAASANHCIFSKCLSVGVVFISSNRIWVIMSLTIMLNWLGFRFSVYTAYAKKLSSCI